RRPVPRPALVDGGGRPLRGRDDRRAEGLRRAEGGSAHVRPGPPRRQLLPLRRDGGSRPPGACVLLAAAIAHRPLRIRTFPQDDRRFHRRRTPRLGRKLPGQSCDPPCARKERLPCRSTSPVPLPSSCSSVPRVLECSSVSGSTTAAA